MRTTLDIDDDVLMAAKELAAKERKTAGRILSEYFRRALHAGRAPSEPTEGRPGVVRNGVPLVASRGEVVTSEHVQKLMDREGI
jgi:hypothetical protein